MNYRFLDAMIGLKNILSSDLNCMKSMWSTLIIHINILFISSKLIIIIPVSGMRWFQKLEGFFT